MTLDISFTPNRMWILRCSLWPLLSLPCFRDVKKPDFTLYEIPVVVHEIASLSPTTKQWTWRIKRRQIFSASQRNNSMEKPTFVMSRNWQWHQADHQCPSLETTNPSPRVRLTNHSLQFGLPDHGSRLKMTNHNAVLSRVSRLSPPKTSWENFWQRRHVPRSRLIVN